MLWAALGSLILLLALCWVFMRWARAAKAGAALPKRLLAILPKRWSAHAKRFTTLFAEGANLPRRFKSLTLIFGAAFLMKVMAAAHLAFAGYAFGADLSPLTFLFVMVCLGFAVVIASTLKIVGGFIASAVILLQQFDVDIETATAMALSVSIASRLTVTRKRCDRPFGMSVWIFPSSISGRRRGSVADDVRNSSSP